MRLVDQNVQLAPAVSEYAYVLSHGKVEIEGEAPKAYLGL